MFRANTWGLATLPSLTQSFSPSRAVKETGHSETGKDETVGPHWEEEQIKSSEPQVYLQGTDRRFRFK